MMMTRRRTECGDRGHEMCRKPCVAPSADFSPLRRRSRPFRASLEHANKEKSRRQGSTAGWAESTPKPKLKLEVRVDGLV